MRLLRRDKTGSISYTSDLVGSEIPKYAILSHTWGKDTDEVTYDDFVAGTGTQKSGYNKIEFCSKQAAADNLEHFWIVISVLHTVYKIRGQFCAVYMTHNPFLGYAVKNWTYHMRCVDSPSRKLIEAARKMLSSQDNLRALKRLSYFCSYNEICDINKDTIPLHYLVGANLVSLAKTYIVEDQLPIHSTVLAWASDAGSVESVDWLLKLGVDPNQYEHDGWSALHWACRMGHLEVVQLLLQNGASMTQMDSEHLTPLGWAVEQEHGDIVDMLRTWTRDTNGRAQQSIPSGLRT